MSASPTYFVQFKKQTTLCTVEMKNQIPRNTVSVYYSEKVLLVKLECFYVA